MTDENPAPGLRERKKAARREALISASHELVAEHGLDHVTVEMICERVGVSSRTFFNYFESKVDAVLAIGPWALDDAAVAVFVGGGPTGNDLDDCAYLVTQLLADPPVAHARLHTVMELARREPSLIARQMAWFEDHRTTMERLVARRADVEEPGPREALTHELLGLLVRSTYRHWESSGCADDPVRHLPGVVDDLRSLTR